MADSPRVGKWSKPWQKDRENIVYFCPICGSTELTWIGGLPLFAPHMECQKCGHRGVFILGDEESVRDVKENYLQGQAEDHIEETIDEDE